MSMSAKSWLDLLASLAARRHPGNRAHLAGLAPALAKAVPKHWLTPDLAEKVEPHLLDRSKLDELVAALRTEAALLPERPTVVAATGRPAETPFERAEREAREDRDWWNDRIARIRAIADPTTRWRESVGMASTLERPKAHARPWAMTQLSDIIAEAIEAGADTDPERVAYARGHERFRPRTVLAAAPPPRGPSGADTAALTRAERDAATEAALRQREARHESALQRGAAVGDPEAIRRLETRDAVRAARARPFLAQRVEREPGGDPAGEERPFAPVEAWPAA